MGASLGPTDLASDPGSALSGHVTSSKSLTFPEPVSSLIKEVNDFGSESLRTYWLTDRLEISCKRDSSRCISGTSRTRGQPGLRRTLDPWQTSHWRVLCPWSLPFCPVAPFLLSSQSPEGQKVTFTAGGFHASDWALRENSFWVPVPNSAGEDHCPSSSNPAGMPNSSFFCLFVLLIPNQMMPTHIGVGKLLY